MWQIRESSCLTTIYLENIQKQIWQIRESVPMRMTLGWLPVVGRTSPLAREFSHFHILNFSPLAREFSHFHILNFPSISHPKFTFAKYHSSDSDLKIWTQMSNKNCISLLSVGKLVDLTTNIVTWGRR